MYFIHFLQNLSDPPLEKLILLRPFLAVYCVRLSHAITCPFSEYFQILHIFAQIFKHFALFLKNRTHALTF